MVSVFLSVSSVRGVLKLSKRGVSAIQTQGNGHTSSLHSYPAEIKSSVTSESPFKGTSNLKCTKQLFSSGKLSPTVTQNSTLLESSSSKPRYYYGQEKPSSPTADQSLDGKSLRVRRTRLRELSQRHRTSPGSSKTIGSSHHLHRTSPKTSDLTPPMSVRNYLPPYTQLFPTFGRKLYRKNRKKKQACPCPTDSCKLNRSGSAGQLQGRYPYRIPLTSLGVYLDKSQPKRPIYVRLLKLLYGAVANTVFKLLSCFRFVKSPFGSGAQSASKSSFVTPNCTHFIVVEPSPAQRARLTSTPSSSFTKTSILRTPSSFSGL